MRSLSQIIVFLALSAGIYAQSPHGTELKIECKACHTSTGWKMVAGTFTFDHNKNTDFVLEGMHAGVNCKLCHPSLVFSKAEPECVSCHTDIHQQTVGMDCVRCHTPKSWIVDNITEIHRMSRFPLVGAHLAADCYQCHPSASLLKFEPLGIECYDCHQQDYNAAKNPDHVAGNYSKDCLECHTMNGLDWGGANFNHSFFPLTKAHAISDCSECHPGGNDFTTASADCISCHQKDYIATTNPNHITAEFTTECTQCHTTDPGWKPAEYIGHDPLFPVYSGKHKDEWISCADCHTNQNDFGLFSCIDCHEHNQIKTDDEHNEVGGYLYESIACFECHPTGNAEDGTFDHNTSNFPLTGAHLTTDCKDCHVTTWAGTPTDCYACHKPDYDNSLNPAHGPIGLSTDCQTCHSTDPDWQPAVFPVHNDFYTLTGAHATIANNCFDCHAGDYNNTPNLCAGCHISNYNQTTNPNHNAIGISNDCETCHTTNPDWKPAEFPVHNDYYVLEGAHVSIDCFTCHQENYNSTPNTCFGCHAPDYNQTTNPNHTGAQFPTTCEDCHTQNLWVPSTFDHDGQYFPIYSGAHNNEWDLCSDCHQNPNNYAEFTCITCHQEGETNNEHEGISGYQYNSIACLACHPDGSGAGGFDHNTTNFPLTGAHTSVNCLDCHQNGYAGTPTDCFACHEDNFNQSTNPDHNVIGIPNTCDECHTTNPGWQPATFPIHSNYYELQGAHAAIANQCADCHNGNYNSTPNTCFGCHESNYNQTNDPPHQSAQFPTDCEICHNQSAWQPSTFDHDGQYFPIYSGEHQGKWDQCSDCHEDPNNYAVFTCLTCHLEGQTNGEHEGISGYQYNSIACLQCHPDGGGGSFNHNNTAFPLTGAHLAVACIDCHESGYAGTPTDCYACHEDNFNQTANPNHNGIGIPNTCDECHTTNPGWSPATFPIHDNYYQLQGAHVSIADQCADCHNGNYNSTPNTCFGCHQTDYNQANDPEHLSAQIPTTCEDCHTQNAWQPSTLNHDNLYFPIYSGEHHNKWDQCTDCHTTPGNFTFFNCIICHTNAHNQNQGNEGCYNCHPNGNGDRRRIINKRND